MSRPPGRRRSDGEYAEIDVHVHGWVYDIGTGLVRDLNISVGAREGHLER